MRKGATLFLVLFLLGTIQFANGQSISSQSITGTWLSEQKDGEILIYQSGDHYFGKLIWGSKLYDTNGTPIKDLKNPDQNLKKRNLLNAVILTDFIWDDGQWKDGKVYDPNNGKTYNATLKLKNQRLEIRGFVGISLIGRTTVWSKVN